MEPPPETTKMGRRTRSKPRNREAGASLACGATGFDRLQVKAQPRELPNPKHFAALPIRVTSRAGGKKWSLGIHHSAACMSVYCGLQAQSELCAPDHQPGFSCGNRETMRTRYALQRVQQQAEWVHTRQPLPPLVSLYRGGSCSGRDDACRRSVSRPSCAHTTTTRAREPIDRSS
jgi:hypothetical protein